MIRRRRDTRPVARLLAQSPKFVARDHVAQTSNYARPVTRFLARSRVAQDHFGIAARSSIASRRSLAESRSFEVVDSLRRRRAQ